MIKKLTSHSLLFIIFALCLSFSTGCGNKEEKIEARAYVDSYFKSIRNQSYNHLLSFYSDEAFGVVSPAKALRGMKKAQNSFGSLRSFELKKNSIFIIKNKSGGITAKLTYNVVYQKMKTKETFAILRISGKNRWIITNHTIDRKK